MTQARLITRKMILQNSAERLWQMACAYDNVNPSELFIVFSDTNIYKDNYDIIVKELQTL